MTILKKHIYKYPIIIVLFLSLFSLAGCSAQAENEAVSAWTISIRNHTGLPLSDVSLQCGKQKYSLDSIAKGDTASISVSEEDLDTALTSVSFSCVLPSGNTESGYFDGLIPENTVINVSLAEDGGLDYTTNIQE